MKKSGDRYVVVPIGLIVLLVVTVFVMTMRSCGYRPQHDSISASNGGPIKDYVPPAGAPPGQTPQ
jgi:hypothetical protein